ncbi:unnamed protein product [Macrosiphum euphorbiae]|nr:unnamed protein product [Macrosiphum euphorbiae]
MVLDTLLKLTNDNLKSCISSIQPLFTQPFNKSNIPFCLFPPSSVGAYLLDYDLVQTELEILFSMLQEDRTLPFNSSRRSKAYFTMCKSNLSFSIDFSCNSRIKRKIF